MTYDLLIRNGTVVREDRVGRADVAVVDEKIVEIAPDLPGDARETIDAAGLHVFPGVIDPHVHFNEPGRTEWEGFATGSAALAAGGSTLFFDMPLNSSPPVLDGESFDLKLEAAKKSSLTDFALWGGLTPKNLDRMEELAERGVVGFKAFMCDSGIEDFPYADPDTLCAGMRIAAQMNLPVAVHAEDPVALGQAAADVRGNTWRDYLASRPAACECAATRVAIECARVTGCALHVVHVSCPSVLDVIRFERERGGVNVTCETCPHYFTLSADDLPTIGARAKCAPPLRSKGDAELLVAALHGGDIDFVASDHSPAPASMKDGLDAFKAWGGIAGVQSTLPALLTKWTEGSYPFRELGPLIAANAAKRFRIPDRGRAAVGCGADLAIVDSGKRFVLTREDLLDRHKLSPYVGRTFRGVIRRTILRGRTIFVDGKTVGPPRGKLVVPKRI